MLVARNTNLHNEPTRLGEAEFDGHGFHQPPDFIASTRTRAFAATAARSSPGL